MLEKNISYSSIIDGKMIRSALRSLSESTDYHIFAVAFADMEANGKKLRISKRMYGFLSSLLAKYEFRLDPETLKEALLSAQTNEPFDNYELYCISCCTALIVLRTLKQMSDKQISSAAVTLRNLSQMNFDLFFSEVSMTERLLLNNEVYANSDRDTKNAYLAKIEKYAKKHDMSEYAAALQIGLPRLSEDKNNRAGTLYFCTMGLMFLFLSVIELFLSKGRIAVPILLIFPNAELSRQICDMLFSKLAASPVTVPKYELADVPDDAKTLVVNVCLLGENQDEVFSKLESIYLCNKDKNICFGILADLRDSPTVDNSTDEKVISLALEHLEILRQKYGDVFFLFMRRRSFNGSERKFIGWERKRGALLELCRLIKNKDTSFSHVCGNTSFLHGVKYIITLDSDTELGIGKAKKLIGAMLHPENKAQIKDGIVVSGYGIMQPNMSASLLSENASDFSLILCGGGGTDLYSSATFDVYQNLFSQGSFCGKGIFDVDCYISLLDTAFAEDKILSHDLLEGERMRTAYLSDITLTDSCPSGVIPYFKRLERWGRGDMQALAYAKSKVYGEDGKLYDNPIGKLSKYKIADNARRIITPVLSMLAVLLSGLFGERALSCVICFVLLPLVFPAITGLIFSGKHGGRRFFGAVIPELSRGLANALFNICSLFHSAVLSLGVITGSIIRMKFTHKGMLRWTTAEEADKVKNGLLKNFAAFKDSFIGGILLMAFYPFISVKLLGVLFMLFPFYAYILSKKAPSSENISKSKIATLTKYAFDMWKFYRDNVVAEDNCLPPDNIQYSPQMKIAHRSSPTNIGMYLLSVLAARIFGFVSSKDMAVRISDTLSTVELMEKSHGHLYNWYDTRTLEPLGTPYISTVDSGNFVCSLLTLKEGLYDYIGEYGGIGSIIERLDSLISETDFSILYDRKRDLFCISYDPVSEQRSINCYDIFMSEARTTSYYAIAMGIAPKKHWAKLSRKLVSDSGYTGLASWSGTAFEFFMPAIFLPVYKNSLSYEALKFAFAEQSRVRSHGIFGKSESAYYTFDGNMNYQYKAHGVDVLGLAGGLNKEKVFAPYASVLGLCVSVNDAVNNLERFKSLGLYGKYGFYEAVDFTRAVPNSEFSVIRSFMAHHIGMSILAITNTCFDGIIRKKFMSNKNMNAANELLCERISTGAVISRRNDELDKERIGNGSESKEKLIRIDHEQQIDGSLVNAPYSALLSNGNLSVFCSSNGDISINSGKNGLCVDDNDMFSFGGLRVLFSADDKHFSFLSCRKIMKCDNLNVKYRTCQNGIKSELKISVGGEESCVCISLDAVGHFKNVCPMLCFEPMLCEKRDMDAHPSYKRLFIESSYDSEAKILFFHRRGKDENWCGIALPDIRDFEFITEKGSYFSPMYDEKEIDELLFKKFDCVTGNCINPYCAVKKHSESYGKYHSSVLIAMSESRDGVVRRISRARMLGEGKIVREYRQSLLKCVKQQMLSAGLTSDSLRISGALLSAIKYELKSDNTPKLCSAGDVFAYGLSLDTPIIALECGEDGKMQNRQIRICSLIISALKFLAQKGCRTVLAVICREGDLYSETVKNLFLQIDSAFCKNRQCCIFVKDRQLFSTVSHLYIKITDDTDTDSLIRDILKEPYQRCIANVKSRYTFENPQHSLLNVSGGSFMQNGFVCGKPEPGHPKTMCYSSAQFGTPVSEKSLGFTYYENSHEKRVTEWNQDPYHELCGERILLKLNGKIFDLCAYSDKCYFTYGCAVWSGIAEGIGYKVYCGCDTAHYAKLINVELYNDSPLPISVDAEYETVICMSSGKVRKSRIIKQVHGGTEFFCYALGGKKAGYAFKYNIGGDKFTLSPGSTSRFGYVLGVCRSPESRDYEAIHRKFRSTSDIEKEFCNYANRAASDIMLTVDSNVPSVDTLVNFWLPYQVIHDRLYARCGFSQPGGAYGFRDQLQDSVSLLCLDSRFAKYQIARCCAHQYKDGSVMHWWHVDGSTSHGLKSRISDDPLWLAEAIGEYYGTELDTDYLSRKIYYIYSEDLSESEKDRYEKAEKSDLKESIYRHGMRALIYVLERIGQHGLLLMGSGDWNDGMNEAGDGAESVWLTMFAIVTINSYIPVCRAFFDENSEKYLLRHKTALEDALKKHGYSNTHFLRGYYPDGKAFGKLGDLECEIDSVVQSFAVLCGLEKEKTERALNTALKKLYRTDEQLLLLLFPAFDGIDRRIGYISDYPPGVRENGGSYCHAACFFAYALCKSGKPSCAFEILSGINPVYRSSVDRPVSPYCGEPYSFPGDILYDGRHTGLCGWTHYTGTAGWVYRIFVREFLGIKAHGKSFSVIPELPGQLSSPIIIKYTAKNSSYSIRIEQRPHLNGQYEPYKLDGKKHSGDFNYLEEHFIEITVENPGKM